VRRQRCGNLEEWNKYWIDEEIRRCSFYDKGRNCLKHYIEECVCVCREIKGWFKILRKRKEDIWKRIWSEDLDERKGEILVRIWKTKKKVKKRKEEGNLEERRIGERKADWGEDKRGCMAGWRREWDRDKKCNMYK